MTKTYLKLPASETAVLQAAAHVYAAYIIAGRIKEGEEKLWMKRALKAAMSFAKTIDQYGTGEGKAEEATAEDSDEGMPTPDELEAELSGASTSSPKSGGKKKPKGPPESPDPFPIESEDDAGYGDDMRAVIDELAEEIGDSLEAGDDEPDPKR